MVLVRPGGMSACCNVSISKNRPEEVNGTKSVCETCKMIMGYREGAWERVANEGSVWKMDHPYWNSEGNE